MTASELTEQCFVDIGRCRRAQGDTRKGSCGACSLYLSPFLSVHHGARTRGRKKKESRISSGVYQLTRGIISSYFPYLERAVRETV